MTPNVLKDIIQWDVKTWSKTLPFWDSNYPIRSEMKVLTIGERSGGLSLWAALKGAKVTCTDFREFPEETRKLHSKHNLESHIEYKEGVDVSNLSSFEDKSFDIVLFKSVIGALSSKEKQQLAFDEMYRVLKPEGAVLFAENCKGSKLHESLRKKYNKWDHYWRYLDSKNDLDLFNKFGTVNFQTRGFFATFGRSEKQRTILSYLDNLTHPLIPSKSKYVLFGTLIK